MGGLRRLGRSGMLLAVGLAVPAICLAAGFDVRVSAALDDTARAVCLSARVPGGARPDVVIRQRLQELRGRLSSLGVDQQLPGEAIEPLTQLLARPRQACRPDLAAFLRRQLASLPATDPRAASTLRHHHIGSVPQPPPAAAPPPPAPPPPVISPPPAPPPAMSPPAAPAPAPAPVAAAPPGARSPVDVALDKLATGHAAFNAPDHATLGQRQQVEARLSAVETESQLAAELAGPGVRQGGSLKISDQMSATLDGGGGLDVSPAGPQTQFVSGRDSTVWDWTVTPKEEGRQTLTLTFDVALTVDGEHGTRHITTLRRTVDVAVGPRGWLDKIKAFFDEISWLWSVPVLAGAGLVTAWWRGRKTGRS